MPPAKSAKELTEKAGKSEKQAQVIRNLNEGDEGTQERSIWGFHTQTIQ